VLPKWSGSARKSTSRSRRGSRRARKLGSISAELPIENAQQVPPFATFALDLEKRSLRAAFLGSIGAVLGAVRGGSCLSSHGSDSGRSSHPMIFCMGMGQRMARPGHHDRPAILASERHCGCANACSAAPVRTKTLTCQMTENPPFQIGPIGRVKPLHDACAFRALEMKSLNTDGTGADSCSIGRERGLAGGRIGWGHLRPVRSAGTGRSATR